MKTSEMIRYLRLKNNLTSKELSKALNISESSISLYENGKRKPSIELIIKMAYFFNVTTDFLLGVSSTPQSDVIDLAELLDNLVASLNNQNYIVFDGKDVDDRSAIIFKKNLTFVLENMRMITTKTM